MGESNKLEVMLEQYLGRDLQLLVGEYLMPSQDEIKKKRMHLLNMVDYLGLIAEENGYPGERHVGYTECESCFETTKYNDCVAVQLYMESSDETWSEYICKDCFDEGKYMES